MPFEPATLARDAGYALLDVLQDEQTQQAALPALEGLAPGFTDWIVTALFGGTYQRPALGLRPGAGMTLPHRRLLRTALRDAASELAPFGALAALALAALVGFAAG